VERKLPVRIGLCTFVTKDKYPTKIAWQDKTYLVPDVSDEELVKLLQAIGALNLSYSAEDIHTECGIDVFILSRRKDKTPFAIAYICGDAVYDEEEQYG